MFDFTFLHRFDVTPLDISTKDPHSLRKARGNLHDRTMSNDGITTNRQAEIIAKAVAEGYRAIYIGCGRKKEARVLSILGLYDLEARRGTQEASAPRREPFEGPQLRWERLVKFAGNILTQCEADFTASLDMNDLPTETARSIQLHTILESLVILLISLASTYDKEKKPSVQLDAEGIPARKVNPARISDVSRSARRSIDMLLSGRKLLNKFSLILAIKRCIAEDYYGCTTERKIYSLLLAYFLHRYQSRCQAITHNPTDTVLISKLAEEHRCLETLTSAYPCHSPQTSSEVWLVREDTNSCSKMLQKLAHSKVQESIFIALGTSIDSTEDATYLLSALLEHFPIDEATQDKQQITRYIDPFTEEEYFIATPTNGAQLVACIAMTNFVAADLAEMNRDLRVDNLISNLPRQLHSSAAAVFNNMDEIGLIDLWGLIATRMIGQPEGEDDEPVFPEWILEVRELDSSTASYNQSVEFTSPLSRKTIRIATPRLGNWIATRMVVAIFESAGEARSLFVIRAHRLYNSIPDQLGPYFVVALREMEEIWNSMQDILRELDNDEALIANRMWCLVEDGDLASEIQEVERPLHLRDAKEQEFTTTSEQRGSECAFRMVWANVMAVDGDTDMVVARLRQLMDLASAEQRSSLAIAICAVFDARVDETWGAIGTQLATRGTEAVDAHVLLTYLDEANDLDAALLPEDQIICVQNKRDFVLHDVRAPFYRSKLATFFILANIADCRRNGDLLARRLLNLYWSVPDNYRNDIAAALVQLDYYGIIRFENFGKPGEDLLITCAAYHVTLRNKLLEYLGITGSDSMESFAALGSLIDRAEKLATDPHATEQIYVGNTPPDQVDRLLHVMLTDVVTKCLVMNDFVHALSVIIANGATELTNLLSRISQYINLEQLPPVTTESFNFPYNDKKITVVVTRLSDWLAIHMLIPHIEVNQQKAKKWLRPLRRVQTAIKGMSEPCKSAILSSYNKYLNELNISLKDKSN